MQFNWAIVDLVIKGALFVCIYATTLITYCLLFLNKTAEYIHIRQIISLLLNRNKLK
jgi:hypothetical protein